MKRGYSRMRCGLIGNKLGHSFSPLIHSRLADYSYDLIELAEDEVESFVKDTALDAFNVTIPYKKTVMPFLDVISPEALAIGAVNTVVRKDGKLYGYNTDYYGFSRMLDILDTDVEGRKTVVFGTGGAATTVCAVLHDKGVSELVSVSSKNNTPEFLAPHRDAEIIVNTTPVGMFPKNGVSPLNLDDFPHCKGVLDVIYNPSKTRLLLDAEARGIKHVGGLPMLVAQAIQAFELFTGDSAEYGECERITELIESQTKNVILIGMPGCGKTTVGKIIASMLDRPFYDADETFTQAYGVTPADVIKSRGEDEFRKMEHSIAQDLGKLSGTVISCGGGVVTRKENYGVLHQNGTIVFLERELDKLSKEGRPLSQSRPLEEIYASRIDAYRRFADVSVKSTEIKDKTAELIISSLGLGKDTK